MGAKVVEDLQRYERDTAEVRGGHYGEEVSYESVMNPCETGAWVKWSDVTALVRAVPLGAAHEVCPDNLGGPGPHSCIYCGDYLPCALPPVPVEPAARAGAICTCGNNFANPEPYCAVHYPSPGVEPAAPRDPQARPTTGDVIEAAAHLEAELREHVPTFPRASYAVRDVLERHLRKALFAACGAASQEPTLDTLSGACLVNRHADCRRDTCACDCHRRTEHAPSEASAAVRPPETPRVTAPATSCQSCGCDTGAHWVCEQHRKAQRTGEEVV